MSMPKHGGDAVLGLVLLVPSLPFSNLGGKEEKNSSLAGGPLWFPGVGLSSISDYRNVCFIFRRISPAYSSVILVGKATGSFYISSRGRFIVMLRGRGGKRAKFPLAGTRTTFVRIAAGVLLCLARIASRLVQFTLVLPRVHAL
jgi:hypothetical protein